MKTKSTTTLVNRIIKRYGAVIDLKKNPEVIIDILRKFADEIPDGGTPCGGTPPTGPTKIGVTTLDDLMKAVLTLSREVNAIKNVVSSKT